ncbi:hypothetical protein [Pseudomonas phage KPP25]|uniref:Uncharacterized protein n=1 Tax=Pseudomonas phage KPP25 TaxID=1462608 RepID=X5I2L8_BPKP2|nr:hypothetical protein FF13_gp39 [Pseudomonas phage KPP25]BAO58511.1 hypothetical protein [Pseudomonas phage KPP25]
MSTNEPRNWLNHYSCSCGCEWSDEWSCQCDDKCPECGTACSPTKSEWIGTELPNPSIGEKMRLRHYYGYMRLRFNADGTVDAQKGSSWGPLLTNREWMKTLTLWRQGR